MGIIVEINNLIAKFMEFHDGRRPGAIYIAKDLAPKLDKALLSRLRYENRQPSGEGLRFMGVPVFMSALCPLGTIYAVEQRPIDPPPWLADGVSLGNEPHQIAQEAMLSLLDIESVARPVFCVDAGARKAARESQEASGWGETAQWRQNERHQDG